MAIEKVKQGVKGCWEMVVKIGGEDPRKIVHALKVGVAMAAVSLIYYFDLFHDGYSTGSGLYAMWAVNTVAVVFEFSIGPVPPSLISDTIACFPFF